MTHAGTINVIALTHDLVQRKSFVSLVWSAEPGKTLGLEVPFGCALDEMQAEAERAVRDLSAELATITVGMPG